MRPREYRKVFVNRKSVWLSRWSNSLPDTVALVVWPLGTSGTVTVAERASSAGHDDRFRPREDAICALVRTRFLTCCAAECTGYHFLIALIVCPLGAPI